MTIQTIHTASARELAHRRTGQQEVVLLWHGKGDVSILVSENMRVLFEIHPPSDRALDAFEHPFVYRAAEQERIDRSWSK